MNRPALLQLAVLAAFAAAPLAPAHALTVTRGPFLQLLSPYSVLVVWRTDQLADTSVEHGLDESYRFRDSDPGRVTDHALLLTDLVPGTLYHYRIGGDGQVLSEGKTFRTAPDPSLPTTSFRFTAFGDSGTGVQAQLDVAAWIERSEPDLVIHVGDVVYPGGPPDGDLDTRFFQVYRETLARAPCYISLGNKELELDGAAAYLAAFHFPEDSPRPERYYSFNYGNALFVALDTNDDLSAGSVQHRWLEEKLEATDRFWKIVFLHHPIHSSTPGVPPHRASLEPLFDRHRVDLVLQGQNHYYERTFPLRAGSKVDDDQEPDYRDPGGTIYLVTGGGGGSLAVAVPDSRSARYASVFHHLEIEVVDSVLSLRAVDRAGAVLDAMTLTRDPGPRPQPPAGLRAIRGSGRVLLDWIDNAEPDLDGYLLFRSRSPEGPSRLVPDAITASEHSDELVESGAEYCYFLAAVDRDGRRSGPSDEVCAVPFGGDELLFRRGDVDGSGRINVTDPISLLGHLFLGEAAPACVDAADADDSGRLNLTDPILLLSYLFTGGPGPADSWQGACGPDHSPADPPFPRCIYPEASCR